MQLGSSLKGFSWTPQALTIDWSDGRSSEFPSIWLRDNCLSDRDSQNGQRLIDVTDLPSEPKIHAAALVNETIVIEWEDESCPAPFGIQWLARGAEGFARQRPELSPRLWLEGSKLEVSTEFAWTTLAAFRDDFSTRSNWMGRLIQDGIAFLRDVPCTDHAVLEPVQLMGFIQETNYGRVFDVRFLPRPENLADSDRGLGLHTDNPYRKPVPGFQTLHFLVASPEGGESLFADGFAIAADLRSTEPELFAMLTRTPVPFLFRSKDAELYAERPLIQLSQRGEIEAVHYNSRSIAPLCLGSHDIAPFYEAYRRFAFLLRDERFQMRVKLSDGDLVAFDNRRILHGRTGFSSAKYRRHLQGCYLTRDSVLSTTTVLGRKISPTRESAS